MKAIVIAPAFLTGLPPALIEDTSEKLIGMFADASEAAAEVKALDAQAEFAQLIEDTVLGSAADLIDFAQADSFAAAASDAVAAA